MVVTAPTNALRLKPQSVKRLAKLYQKLASIAYKDKSEGKGLSRIAAKLYTRSRNILLAYGTEEPITIVSLPDEYGYMQLMLKGVYVSALISDLESLN